MSYEPTPNRRRRPRQNPQLGQNRTPMARVQMPGQTYHGPRGTQMRGNGRKASRSSLKATGGYPLRARSINFQGARGRRGSDRRTLILTALGVVLAVLAIVSLSTCVRGCVSAQEAKQQEEATPVNAIDSRVAAGASDDVTRMFADALDDADTLKTIAAQADQYSDTALLSLAIDVPEARAFVAGYPTSSKEASAYTGSVEQGTAPELYDWDGAWGAVDYDGHALAVSGSGPTSLSMAYMGLTGKTDKTPADVAALATENQGAGGDTHMEPTFLETAASGLGLTITRLDATSDNILYILNSGGYVLVQAKSDTLTDEAHWVLATAINSNSTVVVHDPTSPDVTAREWSSNTLASSALNVYAVTAASTSDSTTTE